MGNLDVPEVLIVLGILAGIAWAIYNRRHPHPVINRSRRSRA
jgi:hypothetical protein